LPIEENINEEIGAIMLVYQLSLTFQEIAKEFVVLYIIFYTNRQITYKVSLKYYTLISIFIDN